MIDIEGVYVQLVAVVLLNATGQVLLKVGVSSLGKTEAVPQLLLQVLWEPPFVVGTLMYGLSFVFYVSALSKVELSIAYPFLALTYVLVTVLSVLVLNESVEPAAIVGVILVFIGVSLVGFGYQ